MPITLHDFTKNFVVMSSSTPAFGSGCSYVGLVSRKAGKPRKSGRKAAQNLQKSHSKFFRVFRAFSEKNRLL